MYLDRWKTWAYKMSLIAEITIIWTLTHISLASHKRGICKQCRPRSDAADRGVWSGSSLIELNIWISIKHGNNKNYPDTLILKMDRFKLKVEESTRHEWVNVRQRAFGRVHSEDSDQLAHLRSLIRNLTRRILVRKGCKVSSWGQRKL